MFAAEWDVGDVAVSMLWLFVLILWVYLALCIFGDILRSDDLSGVAKAAWTVAVVGFPYAGVLAYLAVRGDRIGHRMLNGSLFGGFGPWSDAQK